MLNSPMVYESNRTVPLSDSTKN